jgi:hypothetical protein
MNRRKIESLLKGRVVVRPSKQFRDDDGRKNAPSGRTIPSEEGLIKAKGVTKVQKPSTTAKVSVQTTKIITGLKSGGKRYRRIKVLRWWVMPSIFFLPLGVILIEYYLGKRITLEDVKEVYYQQFGVDPWDIELGPVLGSPPSIGNITYSSRSVECLGNLRNMINLHNPKSHYLTSRKIPMMVHQRANSRCLSRKFYMSSVQWASKLKRWSYYLHDDISVNQLLLDNFYPEFPLLHTVVSSSHCLPEPLVSTRLGSDLWAFLILWVFGGVYVDLNYSPGSFTVSTITPNDDGFFFFDTATQEISTKFMAASPRHPIFFYAIQHILDEVVYGSRSTFNFTGQTVLYQAFHDFQGIGRLEEATLLNKRTYQGVNHRSARIVGDLESVGLVKPVFRSHVDLVREYADMGSVLPMETTTKSNARGCLMQMFHSTE